MRGLYWNWKSAVLSVALRTPIFIAMTIDAGPGAVLATAATDAILRVAVAGFSGGLLQQMSRVRPQWLGTTGAFVAVPALSHGAEILIHGQDGTPHLALAVDISLMVSVATTSFDLYAMRRGALIVGSGSASLTADIKRLPRLWLDLVRAIFGRGRPLK